MPKQLVHEDSIRLPDEQNGLASSGFRHPAPLQVQTGLSCRGLIAFTDAKPGNRDQCVVTVNQGHPVTLPVRHTPFLKQLLEPMVVTSAGRL